MILLTSTPLKAHKMLAFNIVTVQYGLELYNLYCINGCMWLGDLFLLSRFLGIGDHVSYIWVAIQFYEVDLLKFRLASNGKTSHLYFMIF